MFILIYCNILITYKIEFIYIYKMVRYEIENDNILIAYGHDKVTGLFLNIYDKRLEWNENNKEEINEMCETISNGGTGCYLSMNTSGRGFGYKVSKEIIIEFMKKYNAKEEHLFSLSNY